MLKTSYIIANKEEVIKSLKKRNFDSEDLIAKLISLDFQGNMKADAL